MLCRHLGTFEGVGVVKDHTGRELGGGLDTNICLFFFVFFSFFPTWSAGCPQRITNLFHVEGYGQTLCHHPGQCDQRQQRPAALYNGGGILYTNKSRWEWRFSRQFPGTAKVTLGVNPKECLDPTLKSWMSGLAAVQYSVR